MSFKNNVSIFGIVIIILVIILVIFYYKDRYENFSILSTLRNKRSRLGKTPEKKQLKIANRNKYKGYIRMNGLNNYNKINKFEGILRNCRRNCRI